MLRFAAVTCLVGFVGMVLAACGNRNVPSLLVVHFDASADALADVGAEGPPDQVRDASPYLGGPCVDDGQCNDMIACTYDSCDQTVGRCRNVPDDTQCDNHIYCDGKERCVPRHGCETGTVVSCSDGDSCHIASCVEATKSCAYAARDVDEDGDPDGRCSGGHDCNDLDPNVSSLHAEVCGNGVDDNCNGVVDETPCVTPRGTACASPVLLPGAGTYRVSTVGAARTFATSCDVTTPSAAQNIVATVTVPAGPNVDLDVWATAGIEVAVAIDGTCGQASSELACASGVRATSVRARANNLPPGMYTLVVTTQSPTVVELNIELLPPNPPAKNVDCLSATPLRPGSPVVAAVVNGAATLPSACPAGTAELTYSFTLAQAQDVHVNASTLRGSGSPVIGLRDATCAAATHELTCRSGLALPIFARHLAPGTYFLTVAATSPIDASVDVELSPPSMTPADQTCAAPPPVAANATVAFDLAAHEEAIRDGCFPGFPHAAYDLSLPSASDVLLIEHVPETDLGAVSLDPPACTSSLACSTVARGGATSGGSAASDGGGATTPVRLGRRNVPAGDYRVVVSDEQSLQGTLSALVRPTVAPTTLPAGGAETCASAVDVSAGGFFTGDTSMAHADYSSPCDAPTTPPGTTPDQVLALNLLQPQRVVLDMEGSLFTTILDVRNALGCPGTPLAGGCYVGFRADKSFLDLQLQAGKYWILIAGYNLDKGAWNLDVRILPP